MSDYISGQDIIDEYNILPFELLHRFIHSGLCPLSPNSGQPITVAQFLKFALDTQGQAANEDPTLVNYQKFVNANSQVDWADFKPSKDEDTNEKINKALLVHIYDRKLYNQLQAMDLMQRQAPPEHKLGMKVEAALIAKAQQPNRPSKKHKEICRARARKIWEVNPDMHPAELVTYTAFQFGIKKKNGDQYGLDTLQKWIKDLWPNKYLGPAKSLNIPPAIIDNLLQN